jgi:AcrR family transcriptional regulator
MERDADVVTSTIAKCSEPTIYRHVPSRAALFEAANLAREGHE